LSCAVGENALAIKSVPRLPTLTTGIRGRRLNSADDLTDEQRQIKYRICGEDAAKLAKQFTKLRLTYPRMTLPEGIVFILLKAMRVEFVYQVDAYGGRVIRGGQVPDFMVPNLSMVIRVQGDYWHSRPEQRVRDEIDKIALYSAEINGQRVKFVIDIWESQLLSCERKQIVEMALNGQEVSI